MAAADTARLIAELSLDPRKYNAGVKNALGSTKKLETGIGRIGKGAGQLSAGLTRAGGAIAVGLGAGLVGAAKAAIDWEDAFAGVGKTVDATDAELAMLSDTLRKMATEMPNSAAELAAIAEQGGAMGIAAKDIESFTRQVAILASTTNVGAEDAATALGQLANIIGLTADEYDNFAASLVDLGNKGSSTEAQILEITRRAGQAAQLFGIAKDETLGWAAAAANLGLNEELAGTALQNILVKLLPKFQTGSKTLQKIMGKTGAEVKKAFKEDAGGALEDLIKQLGKLPKDRRLKAVQDLFGKGSGITRLVLGLADSYDKNLAPALDTATESWEAATAAQIEFEKRNATVRSAISRLKNGLIDAAITVGEGFTPALGKSADQLAKFLRADENRAALKKLGEDIGKAIEGIDWKEVLDGARDFVNVLKVAFDWAKRIFDAFNSLPTEVKAAVAALAVTDKLSGGLVTSGLGNILGGLGESIAKSMAARIPLFGSAFVQPVFVTNMGLGFPGGPGGGGGGFDLLKTLGLASLVAAPVIALKETGIIDALTKGANTLLFGEDSANDIAAFERAIRDGTRPIVTAVERDTNISDPRDVRTPATPTISDPRDARDQTERLDHIAKSLADQRTEERSGRKEIKSAIAVQLAVQVQRKGEQTVRSVDAAKQAQVLKTQENTRETQRGAMQTSASARAAGQTAAIASQMAASRIVAAIYAARPIISVTNVTRTYNNLTNYGSPGADRAKGTGYGIYHE